MSLTKRSGSGSVNQVYGSKDTDPVPKCHGTGTPFVTDFSLLETEDTAAASGGVLTPVVAALERGAWNRHSLRAPQGSASSMVLCERVSGFQIRIRISLSCWIRDQGGQK